MSATKRHQQNALSVHWAEMASDHTGRTWKNTVMSHTKPLKDSLFECTKQWDTSMLGIQKTLAIDLFEKVCSLLKTIQKPIKTNNDKSAPKAKGQQGTSAYFTTFSEFFPASTMPGPMMIDRAHTQIWVTPVPVPMPPWRAPDRKGDLKNWLQVMQLWWWDAWPLTVYMYISLFKCHKAFATSRRIGTVVFYTILQLVCVRTHWWHRFLQVFSALLFVPIQTSEVWVSDKTMRPATVQLRRFCRVRPGWNRNVRNPHSMRNCIYNNNIIYIYTYRNTSTAYMLSHVLYYFTLFVFGLIYFDVMMVNLYSVLSSFRSFIVLSCFDSCHLVHKRRLL